MVRSRGSLVTVAEEAAVVRRNPEAVRKAVENHGLYKAYTPGQDAVSCVPQRHRRVVRRNPGGGPVTTAGLTGSDTPYLTVAQVADLLQVSTRTIQRLTSSAAGKDRLLAVRIGGVVRVRKAALDAYLRAREGR
jgi:excisionase family DNA binding protein